MQYELDQTITVLTGQYVIGNVSAVQSRATCKFKNQVKISGCYKMQYMDEAHYFWQFDSLVQDPNDYFVTEALISKYGDQVECYSQA